jgi:hypothetical protein
MDRYAYSIFCDDIRQEVGQKMSLMGVYHGELHVSALPTFLAKLCIAVFCATPLETPFKSMTIRTASGEVILQEMSISQTDLNTMQLEISSRSTEDDPIKSLYVGVSINLIPFAIEKEQSITVTAIADGVELTAGKLRIKHTPNLVV